MKLVEYYIKLFITFAKIKTDYQTSVSRHEISIELECSERNVIHVLNKMEEKQWIKAVRGKGRGNATSITFLKTLEEMFERFEKYSPKTEDIERLILMFEDYPQLNESHQLINKFINKLFGTEARFPQGVQDECEHLKIPYFRSLYSLNPSQVERQTETHMVKQIFNTLVRYNEERKVVEPSLSHYWEIDHDGKTFTFYLRKGVLFHHSKHLVAEDVKFTFERLKGTSSKWIIKDLDAIKCIGNYIVQFTFNKPSFQWLSLVTSPKCSIVPNDYAQKSTEEFSKTPIGTGPYKIKEHETDFLSLTVHNDYFQERAHIDNITIFVLPSIEKYLNVKNGDADPVFYIPFTILKGHDHDHQLQYIERERLSVKYLMWNMSKEKIRTNEVLRKKLSTILNKEEMVRELGFPRSEPASSFMKQSSSYQSEEIYQNLSDDTFEEPLTLITYDLPPHREDVKWIQHECKEHGITIDPKYIPYSTFMDHLKYADLILSEYVTQESEEVSLFNLFESQTVKSLINFENKEIIEGSLDQASRHEKMANRIEELKSVDTLLCKSFITIPLYWTFQKALYDKNLMGVSLSTIGLVPFNDLFYRKKLK
ncbi:ABC transporter substrate-binding protein [Alkalibacillus haloalkaliphilus]|uniref:ABC transporter substrate-binding protein n=1 Tax=Alkalibacillus haloalkaliphilus TaxID=94136 RepID=UPI0002E6553F|nr:ABC transporter substrate-binding protein [Alkalibacillus haloalkaliphilus]